jgi:hypothetical protein
MIEQDRPDVFGHTIFCDDIRQEVTGKLIFIGAYHGIMFVEGSLPITLPRLCFSVSLFQKIESFATTVSLRIFVPGDSDDNASIQAEMGEAAEGAFKRAADSKEFQIPESEKKYLSIYSNMTFDNFVLQGQGLIKVSADIKGKRYNLGHLRVVLRPQADAALTI